MLRNETREKPRGMKFARSTACGLDQVISELKTTIPKSIFQDLLMMYLVILKPIYRQNVMFFEKKLQELAVVHEKREILVYLS